VTQLTIQVEKWLQKFTDCYLGQASITSRDVLIEKIGANTGFKLSFTSLSIEELALSFRMDGHQSSQSEGLLYLDFVLFTTVDTILQATSICNNDHGITVTYHSSGHYQSFVHLGTPF